MSKSGDRLEEYTLFYEELTQGRERTMDQTKKEYEQTGGLNEDQLAKLSDDLRSPMKENSSESNPMQ